MKLATVFLLLFFTLIVACSQQNSNADRRVIYTLPTSYIGSFHIIIAPQKMKAEVFRKHDIPSSGVLIVKKPIDEEWDDEEIIEFFYRNNGELEEIIGRAGSIPKDTHESRSDTEVKVFGVSVGQYDGIYADCKILSRTYFIGTNADVYDGSNFFNIHDYAQNNPIDCTGMEPGTMRKRYLEAEGDIEQPSSEGRIQ